MFIFASKRFWTFEGITRENGMAAPKEISLNHDKITRISTAVTRLALPRITTRCGSIGADALAGLPDRFYQLTVHNKP